MSKTLLPGLFLMIAVAGCAAGVVTDAGCLAFKPVHPTARDVEVMSDRLVDQILAHNETGARVCGWREATAPLTPHP